MVTTNIVRMIITNYVPVGWHENIVNFSLAEWDGFSTFVALATVLNSSISCRLKLHHYKLMPGSAVGCLVTVASFLTSIAPGSLVFIPFYSYLKLATNGC